MSCKETGRGSVRQVELDGDVFSDAISDVIRRWRFEAWGWRRQCDAFVVSDVVSDVTLHHSSGRGGQGGGW